MPLNYFCQAFNSNLEVSNFPMRERPANTLKMLDMVTKRRKIEIQEEAVCIGV